MDDGWRGRQLGGWMDRQVDSGEPWFSFLLTGAESGSLVLLNHTMVHSRGSDLFFFLSSLESTPIVHQELPNDQVMGQPSSLGLGQHSRWFGA